VLPSVKLDFLRWCLTGLRAKANSHRIKKQRLERNLLRDHLAHGVEPESPGLVQSPWSIGDPRE
jgi:hypothetical protein